MKKKDATINAFACFLAVLAQPSSRLKICSRFPSASKWKTEAYKGTKYDVFAKEELKKSSEQVSQQGGDNYLHDQCDCIIIM